MLNDPRPDLSGRDDFLHWTDTYFNIKEWISDLASDFVKTSGFPRGGAECLRLNPSCFRVELFEVKDDDNDQFSADTQSSMGVFTLPVAIVFETERCIEVVFKGVQTILGRRVKEENEEI